MGSRSDSGLARARELNITYIYLQPPMTADNWRTVICSHRQLWPVVCPRVRPTTARRVSLSKPHKKGCDA